MSAGVRRGATPAALRVMSGSFDGRVNTSQSASCPLCKGVLRFSIGKFGETLEVCGTRRCPNAVPHHPQPDPGAAEPHVRERKKRVRKSS